MKIAVVGTGYVGLVLGACLAENGNDVTCIDKDEAKLRQLRRGVMPIYEPGLEEMVRRNQAEKRLEFTKDLRKVRARREHRLHRGRHAAARRRVGRPDARAGRRQRHRAGDERLQGDRRQEHRAGGHRGARARRSSAGETDHPFSVVSNPEFLKQGAAVEDFLKPDRVVIGVEDDRAKALMLDLYAPFTRTGAPIMVMDCASAELSKYAANAILATRISFMNEVANVCEVFGANVDQVRKAIGSDRRIGPSFLFPGIGFGGSCFPKDIKALIKFADDKGYDFQTLKAVERVNEAQKVRFISKLEAHFGALKNKTIAVWGLSFKPRTDDMREAPAIPLINRLLHARAKVQAYDPQAEPVARRIFGKKIALADNSYGALKGADALVIATEWNEFREPDFNRMRKLMKSPVIFDGRNIYSPGADEGAGVHVLLRRAVMAGLHGILKDPLLSVVMPVYNERDTVESMIARVLAVPGIRIELIVVDDGSKDGTTDILRALQKRYPFKLFHKPNGGKGSALRLGFKEVTGDLVVIQDADTEYSPEEFPELIELICQGRADVVYGSRFLGRHRVFLFTHYLGNMFLTFLTNVLYNTMLTDMETCYKAMRVEVLRSFALRSDGFGIEPEMTAKIFKRGYRVYEVPITYDGRGYDEGKKITWRDGVVALWVLLKYRFTE